VGLSTDARDLRKYGLQSYMWWWQAWHPARLDYFHSFFYYFFIYLLFLAKWKKKVTFRKSERSDWFERSVPAHLPRHKADGSQWFWPHPPFVQFLGVANRETSAMVGVTFCRKVGLKIIWIIPSVRTLEHKTTISFNVILFTQNFERFKCR